MKTSKYTVAEKIAWWTKKRDFASKRIKELSSESYQDFAGSLQEDLNRDKETERLIERIIQRLYSGEVIKKGS